MSVLTLKPAPGTEDMAEAARRLEAALPDLLALYRVGVPALMLPDLTQEEIAALVHAVETCACPTCVMIKKRYLEPALAAQRPSARIAAILAGVERDKGTVVSAATYLERQPEPAETGRGRRRK